MSSGVGGRGTFRCQVCGVEVYSWSGDYDYVDWATIKAKPQRKKIMIKNGLYALTATSRNGVNGEVGGVLILRDGQMHGGDAFVFYTGSYECSAGRWQGKMTNQEHTPTGRPMAARVQHIGFIGTYSDAGAKADAMALVGEQSIRYDATLRLLVALLE